MTDYVPSPSDPKATPEAEEQISQPQPAEENNFADMDEVMKNKAQKYDSVYEEMKAAKKELKEAKRLLSAKSKESQQAASIEDQLSQTQKELESLKAEKKLTDTVSKVNNMLGNRKPSDNLVVEMMVKKAMESGAVDTDIELQEFVDEFVQERPRLFGVEPSKATEPREPRTIENPPVAVSKDEEIQMYLRMSPEERKKQTHINKDAVMSYLTKKATGQL